MIVAMQTAFDTRENAARHIRALIQAYAVEWCLSREDVEAEVLDLPFSGEPANSTLAAAYRRGWDDYEDSATIEAYFNNPYERPKGAA